jgi:hypothetical protein
MAIGHCSPGKKAMTTGRLNRIAAPRMKAASETQMARAAALAKRPQRAIPSHLQTTVERPVMAL